MTRLPPPIFSAKERAVAADRSRESFYFYCRWKMLQRHGRIWQRGPHHPLICAALMRVYRQEVLRQIVNIPPRYSKTQLVEDFISWTLGQAPDSEYMYLSFGATLAADKTSEIRDDVQSDVYREIFPDVRLTMEGQGHWKTSAGGVVYAAGSGGTITGFGAGKMREGFGGALIYDDPHKPDEVYVETNRETVKKNFQDTVESRLNWYNTPIVLIMQALHEQDISQWLKEGGNGEKWEVLSLPAINERGEALWPEKQSIATLRRLQKSAPYTFAGQYMQRPVPLGGAFFSESSLLVACDDPSIVAVQINGKSYAPVPMPVKIDTVYAVIDTAMKSGKAHDGLAVTYFALCRTGVAYPLTILDWDLKQLEGALLETWLPWVFTYLEELAVETQARHGSAGAFIEDKTSGTVLLQQAINHEWPAQGIDSKLTSLGKTERAVNCESYVFGDKVKMTRRAYERVVTYKGSTKNHLMSQVLGFSASVKDQGADDALDTFSYGIALGLGNQAGF